ncbi:MAG: tetratricopeptide repeat protein [Isosphaeraceae bacterium]|jgi:tetratricopeptide (TPR) repeat protein
MTSETSTEACNASPQGAGRQLGRPTRGRRTWIAAVIMILAIVPGFWYFGFRRAEDPKAIWQAGEANLSAGRIDLAEAAANRLSRLREPTPLDSMLRAQLDIANGRAEEAVAGLMRVPDGHPMAAQARLMAGQVELRRHRARFAEQYFRNALQLDPRLVQAHRELIYILGHQLRRPELNAEFLALSRLTELTFDNVFHWCLMRTALWEPSTALQELLLFVQADPEDRWSRLAIADNYRRMGLIDDAGTAIAPLPDSDLDALAIRVMLAIDRHQDDKAEQLLASGPADDPGMAKLRGQLALARRDAPSALRCFQVAYAHAPEDRDALLGLANALTMIGDFKSAAPLREAAKNFELINSLVQRAAIPKERENPKLLRDLGAACATAGRDPEARGWYRLAIARDPLDVESQQALFQIENRDRSRNPTPIRDGESPRG